MLGWTWKIARDIASTTTGMVGALNVELGTKSVTLH